MKKYILVDGNSLFFKSFYGTYIHLKTNKKGFRNQKGVPINALRTFANMMITLKEENKDSNILITFDEKDTQTYRTKFDFYKANRTKQPDDLYIQIPLVKKFLELLGIKWYSNKNYEADDVIGIMSEKLKKDYKVEIITTDRDLLQLVDKNVSVFLSISGLKELKEINFDNFSAHFNNLKPNQIPDLKGIMGDSSDNLKGIKGIGEKTAIKLLQEFDSLEHIIENIDSLTSKSLKENFVNGKQSGILSKELATIIREGELNIKTEELIPKEINKEEMKSFLFDLEVFSILNRLEL